MIYTTQISSEHLNFDSQLTHFVYLLPVTRLVNVPKGFVCATSPNRENLLLKVCLAVRVVQGGEVRQLRSQARSTTMLSMHYAYSSHSTFIALVCLMMITSVSGQDHTSCLSTSLDWYTGVVGETPCRCTAYLSIF